MYWTPAKMLLLADVGEYSFANAGYCSKYQQQNFLKIKDFIHKFLQLANSPNSKIQKVVHYGKKINTVKVYIEKKNDVLIDIPYKYKWQFKTIV